MELKIATRLTKLPPYLFLEIDRLKRKARTAGRDIIDLGIGDPDQPPPEFILTALKEALSQPGVHNYALDQGLPEFRQAIAAWYAQRFRVKLDPDSEILPLIGSKEGLAHLPLALINPGELTLVPDPCYPPYKGGTILAGGKPYLMPLLEANTFLPDFKKVPRTIAKSARLLYLNYPNNPTAATAEPDFYRQALEFARRNKIVLVSDLAYSEIAYDGYRPGSLLELEGAKDVSVEFHSLSKTFNLTGWRIGFACGNAAVIAVLARVKSNIDSGIFNAIQKAGTIALTAKNGHLEQMNTLYRQRRDVLVDGLNSLGWPVAKPRATFYLWSRAPKGYTSIELSQKLLTAADIVVTPGNGFGRFGEGYIRMALTVSEERLNEAVERIRRVL